MHLTENSFDKIKLCNKKFPQFLDIFKEIHQNLTEFMNDPKSPLTAFIIHDLENGSFCVENFGIILKFTLFMSLVNDAPLGEVIVYKTKPKFGLQDKLIGSFNFKSNGATNFEYDQTKEEPHHASYMAPEIICHYFLEALKGEDIQA